MNPSSMRAESRSFDLLGIVAGPANHVLVHRARLGEPALANQLRSERAARAGIVGVGLDESAQDLLALRRALALEQHHRQEPLARPVLGPLGDEVSRALLGLVELTGAREVEDDALLDRRVVGIAMREVGEERERLVHLVLVFVEIDQRRGDLAIALVLREKALVEALRFLPAAALRLGLGVHALDDGLAGELGQLVEHRGRLAGAIRRQQRAREADGCRNVVRREPVCGGELLDRARQARRILLRCGELERAEQPPGLGKIRVQANGLARLAHRLVRDVQVAQELRVLEVDDRVVRDDAERLAIELERLLVAAVGDGRPRREEDPPALDEVRLGRRGGEVRDRGKRCKRGDDEASLHRGRVTREIVAKRSRGAVFQTVPASRRMR